MIQHGVYQSKNGAVVLIHRDIESRGIGTSLHVGFLVYNADGTLTYKDAHQSVGDGLDLVIDTRQEVKR